MRKLEGERGHAAPASSPRHSTTSGVASARELVLEGLGLAFVLGVGTVKQVPASGRDAMVVVVRLGLVSGEHPREDPAAAVG